MRPFEGSFTVLVTPFTSDGGAVDLAALGRLIDWQIAEGVPGLVVLGSTGEFLSVSDEERTAIVETAVDRVAGKVPLLVGTAHEWSEMASRYSREAEALGADGIMVVPPYYSSPTEDEIFAHYRRIAEAVALPVMVYNNPRTANVDLRPEMIARLAAIDNILYVKEASGQAVRTLDIIHLTGGRVTVFARYEAFLLGARGYVSVCGNVAPRLSADMYRLTVTQGDVEAGRCAYWRLRPLIDCLAGDFYVSATKCAMGMIGMDCGPPRPPRLPLSGIARGRIADVVRALERCPGPRRRRQTSARRPNEQERVTS